MGRFFFIAILMAISNASADCGPEQPNENFILKVDYFVSKTMDDVESRYHEVYPSGRRLRNRVYQNSHDDFVVDKLKGEQRIPPSFLQGLIQQLEMILQRRYGEFLIYPDLGHAHLLIPQKDFEAKAKEMTLAEKLSSSRLLLLYHTAELVEMKENFIGPLKSDPWLQWRYYSRNIVSPITEPKNLAVLISDEEKYNTVRSLPGYSEVGRIYFSASEQGCLSLTAGEQKIFFDVNFD